jgi:drug/metabolite transporter (DMT)-like permease
MTVKRFFSDRPAFFIALFTLCWAIIELLGASVTVSAYQVVWTRYGVHLACLLLLVAPRHGRSLGRRLAYTPRLGRQIVRSLLMLVMPLSFVWALYRMSPHNAWSVFWVAPLLVIAIASMTHERVATSRTAAAGVCGLIGAWLIDKPDSGIFQPAAFLALTMAASLALYMVMTRSMRDEPVLPKLFHTALWVFVALSVALPLFWLRPSPESLLAMVAIGVLGLVALFALDRSIDGMKS